MAAPLVGGTPPVASVVREPAAVWRASSCWTRALRAANWMAVRGRVTARPALRAEPPAPGPVATALLWRAGAGVGRGQLGSPVFITNPLDSPGRTVHFAPRSTRRPHPSNLGDRTQPKRSFRYRPRVNEPRACWRSSIGTKADVAGLDRSEHAKLGADAGPPHRSTVLSKTGLP